RTREPRRLAARLKLGNFRDNRREDVNCWRLETRTGELSAASLAVEPQTRMGTTPPLLPLRGAHRHKSSAAAGERCPRESCLAGCGRRSRKARRPWRRRAPLRPPWCPCQPGQLFHEDRTLVDAAKQGWLHVQSYSWNLRRLRHRGRTECQAGEDHEIEVAADPFHHVLICGKGSDHSSYHHARCLRGV